MKKVAVALAQQKKKNVVEAVKVTKMFCAQKFRIYTHHLK